jgi:hypothetical protein
MPQFNLKDRLASYMPTKGEVIRVAEADERLTYAGYGLCGETKICGMTKMDEWSTHRQKLVDPDDEIIHEIAKVRMWLNAIAPTKSKNSNHSSYGLKHRVEGWLRGNGFKGDHYVSNGSFILAAKMDGFRIYGTGNPEFGMSETSIKARIAEE